MGATLFVVMSRRAVTPAIAAPAPTAAPAADKVPPPTATATASAGTATAPDKAADKADSVDKEDKGAGDKPHRSRRHHGGGKSDAVAAKGPSGPSAPSAPQPKRKSDMSQKEIDSLLGL